MDLMWTPELLSWFGENLLAGAATAAVGAVAFGVVRDLTSGQRRD